MKDKLEIIFSEGVSHCMEVDTFLGTVVPGIQKSENPKRMVVEVHHENEYGNNLSGEIIFEIIEKKFNKEKATSGFDNCRMWKINEYVIIMEVEK